MTLYKRGSFNDLPDFSNPAHQGLILGQLSRGIFPSSYGRTRLALLARDPEWALAYWEVRASEISEAVATLKNATTNLRLIDAIRGKVLGSFEVPAASGRYSIPIPQAGRYYAADLVMAHGDRMTVLARSKVMYAPRSRPRFGTSSPVFAGRVRQLEAIRSGKPILRRSGALPVSGGANANLLTARLLGRIPVRISGAVKLASEARLLLIGSEARLWSIGSEARLLGVRRRKFFGLLTPVFLVRPAHIEIVAGLLGRTFGRGTNAGGDGSQYVLDDKTGPVNIGEPDGWAAGTWYAPYDSYSWAPAADQSAPSKGVPGTYAQYNGKSWVEVSPTQSPNDSSQPSNTTPANNTPSNPTPSDSPSPSSVTSVTDASTGQTTTTTTFTAPSGMNDGSTITTVVAVTTDADGNTIGTSISTVTAFSDGGWISVTVDSNGNHTETVTDANGSQISTTTKGDGTSSMTVTDKDGNSNTVDITEDEQSGSEEDEDGDYGGGDYGGDDFGGDEFGGDGFGGGEYGGGEYGGYDGGEFGGDEEGAYGGGDYGAYGGEFGGGEYGGGGEEGGSYGGGGEY